MKPSSTRGFTLIELVIVIIILGIIAAIALPRFVSLQREARIAVIDGSTQALRSGVNIVFAKTTSAGVHTFTNGCVNLETGETASGTAGNDCPADPGNVVRTRFGYPQASSASVEPLFDDLSSRFSFSGGGTGSGATVQMRLDGIEDCRISYTATTTAGTRPSIERVTTGC